MRRTLALMSVLLLLASCAGEREEPPTTNAPDGDGFELAVSPREFFPVIPGQLFVVLVSPTGGEAPVAVEASATGAATVEPEVLSVGPGEVDEFTLIADADDVGSTVTLDLTAERDAAQVMRTLKVEVVEWDDTIQPLAIELRERFVSYLETQMPELGISGDTEWTPTITKPQILVVMHYLFFSEDWEMGIMWHVTVPENAWSRMYLRPRDQMQPTQGLEIPSYLDPESTPVPWEPPAEIDR